MDPDNYVWVNLAALTWGKAPFRIPGLDDSVEGVPGSYAREFSSRPVVSLRRLGAGGLHAVVPSDVPALFPIGAGHEDMFEPLAKITIRPVRGAEEYRLRRTASGRSIGRD